MRRPYRHMASRFSFVASIVMCCALVSDFIEISFRRVKTIFCHRIRGSGEESTHAQRTHAFDNTFSVFIALSIAIPFDIKNVIEIKSTTQFRAPRLTPVYLHNLFIIIIGCWKRAKKKKTKIVFVCALICSSVYLFFSFFVCSLFQKGM